MRPHRRQPTRLPHPWDSQARTLEWVAISFSNALQWKVKCESEVTQSCLTLCDPMDGSLQAPPSMGFSRQKYWSGVPLPSPNGQRYLQIIWARCDGGTYLAKSEDQIHLMSHCLCMAWQMFVYCTFISPLPGFELLLSCIFISHMLRILQDRTTFASNSQLFLKEV